MINFDRPEAQVEAAKSFHVPYQHFYGNPQEFCRGCEPNCHSRSGLMCDESCAPVPWPCPELQAIEKAGQP